MHTVYISTLQYTKIQYIVGMHNTSIEIYVYVYTHAHSDTCPNLQSKDFNFKIFNSDINQERIQTELSSRTKSKFFIRTASIIFPTVDKSLPEQQLNSWATSSLSPFKVNTAMDVESMEISTVLSCVTTDPIRFKRSGVSTSKEYHTYTDIDMW